VVIDARLGERENQQFQVAQADGLRNVHLYEGEDWINAPEAVGDLTRKFLVLNDLYSRGFSIPRRFLGENIIHLPTVKTHVSTTPLGPADPRDAGPPAPDPEADPSGSLCRDGWHLRRGWPRPALHDSPPQERAARLG
jgi:hypothetical protein